MQGPDFLYFFVDDMSRSFFVENGIVGISTSPRSLEFTPGEWQEVVVDNERNQKYFALDRNFTVPLKAVEDGAVILKDQFYRYGIEAIVNLVILKQKLFYDGAEYGYYYDSFYKGEFDFSNFSHTGPTVSINVMEGGLAKLIKAKENVVYEIDIDVPEAVTIKMDGIKLRQQLRYVTINENMIANPSNNINFPYAYSMMSVSFISSEGSLFAGITGSQFGYQYPSNNLTDDNRYPDNYFYQAREPHTINIQFEMDVRLINYLRYELYIKSSKGTRTILFTKTNPAPPVPVTETNHITINQSFALQKDERLYLFSRLTDSASTVAGAIANIFETEISIPFTSTYRTTNVKALRPLYVFEKLISLISEGKSIATSQILIDFEYFVLTSGDALRGISGAKLKTTLSDFFRSYNAQLDLGMGVIEEKAVLEAKSYWVDFSNPIDLGEVKGLTIRPALDYIYNTIKIGSQPQDYEDINGKEEFNNTTLYLTPVTRVTKELDLVSPYRLDSYGAEFTRINMAGKTTTDNQSDNDVFMIHIESTPVIENAIPLYRLDRLFNAYLTGLLEPLSVFNARLSPRQMGKRLGRFIRSLFYKQDSSFLKFQTTDKNAAVALNVDNPPLRENEDILIGSLGDQYFVPIYLEFEVAPPTNLLELLSASPVRPYRFTSLGETYIGLPVKGGVKAINNTQKYIVLSAPMNDLLPLINIAE